MLNPRNSIPAPRIEETKEARKVRRAHQKKIYDWALDRYDQTQQQAEKEYNRNTWLSGLATIISPLSLFVTIPVVRKINASLKIKVLFVLAGLVPLLSGCISLIASTAKKMLSQKNAPPVRKVRMKGKPEEVKDQLKKQTLAFEKPYGGISLAALKDFGKGNPQELENEMQRFVGNRATVTDIRTERIPETSSTQQEKFVYEATEETPSGKLKPSKIFVAVPGKEDETDVYLEVEQNMRSRMRAGQTLRHEVTVTNGDKLRNLNITFTPKFKSRPEESGLAGTFFFMRSVKRSIANFDRLEAKYKAAMAKPTQG